MLKEVHFEVIKDSICFCAVGFCVDSFFYLQHKGTTYHANTYVLNYNTIRLLFTM